MFDGMSKPTLVVATLIGGLALFVAGFIIAAEMRSVAASPTAASTGGGCYTNWNGDTCAAGYTAVETGEWTTVVTSRSPDLYSHISGGTALICATPKAQNDSGVYFTSEVARDFSHTVSHEPCAICCASGAVVGGIGELPSVAATGDPLPRNQVIIAAVTALVAFAAGGWYARRRWSR
jgi:hypothetical protein